MIWDSRSNPLTFDFLMFLLNGSNYFRTRGILSFDLIIYIPKGTELKPFHWNSYDKFVTANDIEKRIEDLIIPIAHSLDCIKDIKIFTNENQIKK